MTYFTTTTKAKRPTTTEPIIGSLFYSGAAFGHYFAYFPGGGKLLRHQSSIVTSRITSCLDPLFAAGRVDAVDTKAVSNLNKYYKPGATMEAEEACVAEGTPGTTPVAGGLSPATPDRPVPLASANVATFAAPEGGGNSAPAPAADDAAPAAPECEGNNEGNNAPAPAPAPPPEGEGDSPLAAAAAQGQQGPFPPAAKGLNLQGGTHDPAAEPARVLAGMPQQPQPPTGPPPPRTQPPREGKGVPGKKFDPTSIN